MEDENTASVSQLDLLLKSEGSEKDHCFAVGILAIQKPCNLFRWLRSIQMILAGMGYAQSRYVKLSVPPLSPVWAAVFPDRVLIITMYTTVLDYDKSRRMAFQTFPAVLGRGKEGS
ncbi:unnamed protein product [Leuciscus chuanchicus]